MQGALIAPGLSSAHLPLVLYFGAVPALASFRAVPTPVAEVPVGQVLLLDIWSQVRGQGAHLLSAVVWDLGVLKQGGVPDGAVFYVSCASYVRALARRSVLSTAESSSIQGRLQG